MKQGLQAVEACSHMCLGEPTSVDALCRLAFILLYFCFYFLFFVFFVFVCCKLLFSIRKNITLKNKKNILSMFLQSNYCLNMLVFDFFLFSLICIWKSKKKHLAKNKAKQKHFIKNKSKKKHVSKTKQNKHKKQAKSKQKNEIKAIKKTKKMHLENKKQTHKQKKSIWLKKKQKNKRKKKSF